MKEKDQFRAAILVPLKFSDSTFLLITSERTGLLQGNLSLISSGSITQRELRDLKLASALLQVTAGNLRTERVCRILS